MKTLIELFDHCVDKYSNNIFLLEKKTDKYTGLTYKKTKEYVIKMAAGLISLGINPDDKLALLSEGQNLWVISELAIFHAAAVNVPLSVRLNEEELLFRLKHSETRMIFVSEIQLPKIRSIKDQLNKLEKIIVFTENISLEDKEISYVEVLNQGEELLIADSDVVEKRKKLVNGDTFANICYTSGTTADPKGIILTHRNYTANIEQSLSLFSVPEWWTTLLILPWDHAFAHTCGIYTLMSCGASLAAVQTGKAPLEALKNIPINIKEIRPTFLLSVPALAKNFKKNIEKAISEKGKFVEFLYKTGLKIAYAYNGIGYNRGKGLRIFLLPIYFIFKILIFNKIKENFGGRLEFFIGGGALLDIDLQRFFYAIGIPMYQGYGLTEAAPVISANNPKKHKLGSSGTLVKNIEVKICDEEGNELPLGEKGEIVVRGENVMKGYWKNEEATKETIKNGWLHTGDMGYLDKDGFLYVLGRFKSLLIADDGEKYSPEAIEEAFCEHVSFLENVMLYNNQKPYTVALVYPNIENIKKWAKNKNIDITKEKGIIEVLKFLEIELNQFDKGGRLQHMFPHRWLPSAIGIIPEPFTQENGMLNSTMKMVRGKITEHYESLLSYLYTPEAKNIANKNNIKVMFELLNRSK